MRSAREGPDGRARSPHRAAAGSESQPYLSPSAPDDDKGVLAWLALSSARRDQLIRSTIQIKRFQPRMNEGFSLNSQLHPECLRGSTINLHKKRHAQINSESFRERVDQKGGSDQVLSSENGE